MEHPDLKTETFEIETYQNAIYNIQINLQNHQSYLTHSLNCLAGK